LLIRLSPAKLQLRAEGRPPSAAGSLGPLSAGHLAEAAPLAEPSQVAGADKTGPAAGPCRSLPAGSLWRQRKSSRKLKAGRRRSAAGRPARRGLPLVWRLRLTPKERGHGSRAPFRAGAPSAGVADARAGARRLNRASGGVGLDPGSKAPGRGRLSGNSRGPAAPAWHPRREPQCPPPSGAQGAPRRAWPGFPLRADEVSSSW